MKPMLSEILFQKMEEVRRLQAEDPYADRDDTLPPPRDFRESISRTGGIHLIGEIKFSSPSAGVIREESDALPLGRAYEEAGASAISLITDKTFFHGDLEQLPILKRNLSFPVLRKDFILDEVQVRESRSYGADALLLITRILSRERLKDLIEMTKELGMTALVEVHSREELDKALVCGADTIGINNRDLDTFNVSLETTFALAPLIPDDCVVVCESGIRSGEDVRRLLETQVCAVLVGTSIMESENMVSKARELIQAGR